MTFLLPTIDSKKDTSWLHTRENEGCRWRAVDEEYDRKRRSITLVYDPSTVVAAEIAPTTSADDCELSLGDFA